MTPLDPLDNGLRHALRREEPPVAFDQRVLARVAERPAVKPATSWRESIWSAFHVPAIGWAVAATVVVAAAVGVQYRVAQRERVDGEAAKQRVVLALRITSSKLQLAQTKVSRMHEQPARNSNE